MEALLANTHKIKGKLREKVEAAKEQGKVSKKLATIDINVPIEFSEKDLLFSEIDTNQIRELFEELEFKTILQRVLSLSDKESVKDKKSDILEKEELIFEGQLDMFSENINSQNEKIEIKKRYSTTKDYDFLLDKIRENGKCSFQILSNNLSNVNDSLFSFSLSVEKDNSFYFFPFTDENMSFLKEILADQNILKTGRDIKDQIKILWKYNIYEINNIFDISITLFITSRYEA